MLNKNDKQSQNELNERKYRPEWITRYLDRI